MKPMHRYCIDHLENFVIRFSLETRNTPEFPGLDAQIYIERSIYRRSSVAIREFAVDSNEPKQARGERLAIDTRRDLYFSLTKTHEADVNEDVIDRSLDARPKRSSSLTGREQSRSRCRSPIADVAGNNEDECPRDRSDAIISRRYGSCATTSFTRAFCFYQARLELSRPLRAEDARADIVAGIRVSRVLIIRVRLMTSSLDGRRWPTIRRIHVSLLDISLPRTEISFIS